MNKTFKLLQIQNKVQATKEATFQHIENLIIQNQASNPDFIMLPEMFACPYNTQSFPQYAEPYRGETYKFLQSLAKKYQVYLVGGSYPEIDHEGKIYNTSYVFNHQGEEIARHCKLHLFDIDIKNGQSFRESDILSPGKDITVFTTPWGKMGLCICFDLRFPELSRLMVDAGAEVVFVPAAFNSTTGPMHWDLLFASRAVDNQIFTVGTATAFDREASYHSWGHSLVVSPWGKIINEIDEQEGLLLTTIDLQLVEEVRQQLPLLHSRRKDLYKLVKY